MRRFNELSEIERQSLIPDYWNMVAQTADFRFSVSWAGARKLMADRGYPADNIIMFGCDQGSGNCVSVALALPDGQIIRCQFNEDPSTRAYVSVDRWKPWIDRPDDPTAFETEVLATPQLKESFDRAVLAYFDFHLRAFDRPLPIVPPRSRL